jgi:DNA-binding Lrp family transcriptional regulator
VGVFLQELEEYLKGIKNLNTLFKLSGEYDYFLELYFKDLKQYQEFEYEIKSSKFVGKVKMNFLSEMFEERFRIPEA